MAAQAFLLKAHHFPFYFLLQAVSEAERNAKKHPGLGEHFPFLLPVSFPFALAVSDYWQAEVKMLQADLEVCHYL